MGESGLFTYSLTGQQWVEIINQNGEDRRADAIGKLQNQQLFPDNEAYLLQGGISLDSDMITNYVLNLYRKLF